MYFKKSVFYISLFFIFVGCSLIPGKLSNLQDIIDSQPDSALQLLKGMQPSNFDNDADRALYGVLLFQTLDNNNLPLQPDSLITFSVNYYQTTNKKHELATSYYYKARVYKKAQRFEEGTKLYLKALDIALDLDDNILLGKIYSDLGEIYTLQLDFKESLSKFQESLVYFEKANDSVEVSYKLIDIGRVYRFLKETNKAITYFRKSISEVNDSLLFGAAYQEIASSYYLDKNYDSAKYYIKQSLRYPYRGTNYAIRCFVLSDLNYNINQYDSAIYYSHLALKYPNTFFIQRDCYRILSNSQYNLGYFDESGKYMAKYQDCTDSVRFVENQTKSTVLENIHEVNGEFAKTKHFSIFLTLVIVLVVLISFYIIYFLRKRSKTKEIKIEQIEDKLIKNQMLLKNSLVRKIEENKLLRITEYKKASIDERELIYKEIYQFCLHLNDWNSFEKLMNQTFNNLFSVLVNKYSDITRKELIWCSLFLLDVPTSDMTIILECQQGSLYKLKQRLTQKLGLSGTKELDQLLNTISTEK